MRWLLLCLLLASCGGGGGSTSTPTPAPQPRAAPLEFMYFGTVAGQLAATADHVSAVFTPDWGDWDHDRAAINQRTIAYLQEAQARGVKKAWVSIAHLLFDDAYHYRGVADLIAFRQQVESLGLGPMVVALYPLDEPDIHNLSDAFMVQVLTEVKAAWPGPKLAVIYGPDGQTPGISQYDYIGRDDYGAGANVVLPPITPSQQWILVPGGAEPWKADPQPFIDRADSRVVAIVAFLWSDYSGGKGIGSNGMGPAYAALGSSIRGAP